MFDSFVKNSLIPLILRLGLAGIFIFHGYVKIVAKGNEFGSNWVGTSMTDPPGATTQLAVAWGELLGGIALGAGLLTRAAALGIVVIMVGAIVTTTGKNGFSINVHGCEYNIAIIIMCTALILAGGGAISADRFLFRKKKAAPMGIPVQAPYRR